MERIKDEMIGRNWGIRSAESKAKLLFTTEDNGV
jgi:hypothetical protein